LTEDLAGKVDELHGLKESDSNTMNYFTPERYLRLENRDNRDTFLSALQEWEDTITAYKALFTEIRKKLPQPLVALMTSVYLHDARVLAMHQEEDQFEVTLQPNNRFFLPRGVGSRSNGSPMTSTWIVQKRQKGWLRQRPANPPLATTSFGGQGTVTKR
jgi:hypothetical protein